MLGRLFLLHLCSWLEFVLSQGNRFLKVTLKDGYDASHLVTSLNNMNEHEYS